MNSFVKAIFTVPGPIAEFIEMNTLFWPDALYVIEWTSDHHLLCTWKREGTQCKNKNTDIPFIPTLIIGILFLQNQMSFNNVPISIWSTVGDHMEHTFACFIVIIICVFAGNTHFSLSFFNCLLKVLILQYPVFKGGGRTCAYANVFILHIALFFTHNRCSPHCSADAPLMSCNKLPDHRCQPGERQRAAA